MQHGNNNSSLIVLLWGLRQTLYFNPNTGFDTLKEITKFISLWKVDSEHWIINKWIFIQQLIYFLSLNCPVFVVLSLHYSNKCREIIYRNMYTIKGETDHQPRLDAWDKRSDLVLWEDLEGAGGEGGGRGDRDGEDM